MIEITGLAAFENYTVNYDYNGVPQQVVLATDGLGVITLANLADGDYSNILVTDANGCSSSATGTITVDCDCPTFNLTLGAFTNPTTCEGNDGTITLSGLDANTTYDVTYTYNFVENTISLASDASGNIVVTGLVAGNYSAISVAIGNCESGQVALVTLTDPNAPSIAIGTTSDPANCGGSNGGFSLTGLTDGTTYNVTYTSSVNGVTTVSLTADGTGTVIVGNLSAGTYSAISVETTGCDSNVVGPITLNDPTSITTFDATTTDATCTGNGSVTLSGLAPNTTYDLSLIHI